MLQIIRGIEIVILAFCLGLYKTYMYFTYFSYLHTLNFLFDNTIFLFYLLHLNFKILNLFISFGYASYILNLNLYDNSYPSVFLNITT